MAWRAMYFNANGGTLNSPSPLYYENVDRYWVSNTNFPSSTRISNILPPSRPGYRFTGFWLNGVQVINQSGILPLYDYGNVGVLAGWEKTDLDSLPTISGPGGFSAVEDFFNLGSAALIPISSQSGDNIRRDCVSNATWSGTTQTGGAGRYTAGVSYSGGVWRNPTVTYMVVGDTTLSLNLGKAYPAAFADGVMSISGYMMTSARVATAARQFPLVTVSGVANEGADAINLFSVSIPILGRARAQNLLGGVSGGGDMLSCVVNAECQPVVLAENNMPCASDVVHGRYALNAITKGYANQNAPVAANGFAVVGQPMASAKGEYLTWNINAEMEIS